jgi:hypothetical protein
MLPAPVHAATSPITVTARTQIMHYPASIDFSVTASDTSSTITGATLYLNVQIGGISGGTTSEQHSVTIQPAKTATLSYSEDTTGNSSMQPGTPISYYWVIQDSANTSYTDTTQNFVTNDSRFPWQHLTHGLLQVNWYNQPQSFGQSILNQAVTALNRISHNLGVTPAAPIHLWIYADHADFAGAIGPYQPEWVGGLALPEYSEAFFVIADANDTTIVRDMPHEMTHLIFAQLEVHALDIPAWFNEGLAVYNQGYHEAEMQQSFQQALATQSLLRLDTLNGSFPQDSDQAYLAYAQSWNLVSYMYHTFGQAKMASFLTTMNSPLMNFNDGMKQTLGVDVAHLENQWRLSLNQPSTLGTPSSGSQTGTVAPISSSIATTLTIGSIVFVCAAFAAVVLVLVTMSRRKRQLMAQEDSQAKLTTEPSTQNDVLPKI